MATKKIDDTIKKTFEEELNVICKRHENNVAPWEVVADHLWQSYKTFSDTVLWLKNGSFTEEQEKKCLLDCCNTKKVLDKTSGVDEVLLEENSFPLVEDYQVKRYNRGYRAGYSGKSLPWNFTKEYVLGFEDGRNQLKLEEDNKVDFQKEQKSKSYQRGYDAGYNGEPYRGKTIDYQDGYEWGEADFKENNKDGKVSSGVMWKF